MKWLVVLVVLCGCSVAEPQGDAGTLPDGGRCPRELVLGTETDAQAFRALVDDAELKIHAGPQGGWHVFVSVQATALPRSGVLSYVLRSGSTVVSAPLRLDLADLVIESIPCGWERRNDALTFGTPADQYRGSSGELEVRFESFGIEPLVVRRRVMLR